MSILIYSEKNINENKSLVPVVTLDDDVKAEIMEFELLIMDYGGTCVQENQCFDSIKVVSSGFNYENKELDCEVIGLNCLVKIVYQRVKVFKDSTIYVSFEDLSAYASGISVKISVYSSIPNEKSENFVSVFPNKNSLLFRGQVPTIIKYELIPSVNFNQLFYSESSQWKSFDSGYHARYTSECTLGTQVEQATYF